MAKVITGTKDKRVRVLKKPRGVEDTQKDIRQIRCNKCKSGLANAVPDGRGGTVCRCPNCGATYNFKKL